MNNNKQLEVYINQRHVGTLAETKDHRMAFEYSDEWVKSGFSISPASLPLQKGVFVPKKYDPFDGLFGVFADSLPDGWGRLVFYFTLATTGTYRFCSVMEKKLN